MGKNKALTRGASAFVVAMLAAVGTSGEIRAAEANPEIDAKATAALDAMGAYLRGLKSFQIDAQVTRELVLDNGQKVEQRSTVITVAQPPNRLMARSTSDHVNRSFYYNGKEFTLWSPRMKYYATIAAPGSIGELADVLDAKYETELPLVDMFRWGTAGNKPEPFTSAIDLGPSTIDGVTCSQYAFRQAGLDWQIWIQRGNHPLPKRIVLTTLDDAARPQFTATYDWSLAPSYNEATFTFVPPKDAQKIAFRERSADSSQ